MHYYTVRIARKNTCAYPLVANGARPVSINHNPPASIMDQLLLHLQMLALEKVLDDLVVVALHAVFAKNTLDERVNTADFRRIGRKQIKCLKKARVNKSEKH